MGNGYIWLGITFRLTFRFNGYATTIVGPGPKGVGDKVGGTTEQSVGL